jgi:adenylylsulfate kinase
MIIWLTGLSGSGKSTLAEELSKVLPRGFLVDGDHLRQGLCADLGFDLASRHEQARRAAGVAKVADANVCTVLCPIITPLAESRHMIRGLLADNDLKVVYVSTPLEECQRRDPKGLYAKVAAGEINDFTGVDSVFEVPSQYDSIVDTTDKSVDECVDQIISDLGL